MTSGTDGTGSKSQLLQRREEPVGQLDREGQVSNPPHFPDPLYNPASYPELSWTASYLCGESTFVLFPLRRERRREGKVNSSICPGKDPGTQGKLCMALMLENKEIHVNKEGGAFYQSSDSKGGSN